jgi:hypothetical protein
MYSYFLAFCRPELFLHMDYNSASVNEDWLAAAVLQRPVEPMVEKIAHILSTNTVVS